MRYRILLDNNYVLFDSWDTSHPEKSLINPMLNRELNAHDALTFSIPPTHPQLTGIVQLKSRIWVFRDEKTQPEFVGRVRKTTTDLFGQVECVCEGITAWFVDTIQRPWTWSGSISGFLSYLLTQHNSQLSADEPHWSLGTVTVTDPNDLIGRSSIDYLTTWEVLTSRLPESGLGGFLTWRLDSVGAPVLDYVTTPGPFSTQSLRIGRNVLDLSRIIDSTDVATRFIPLGAQLENEPTDEDASAPPNGLADPTRLTIESVNGGKDYLQDDALVAELGIVTKTEVFDDIKIASNLLTRGAERFSELKLAAVSITLNAIDLSLIGVEQDQIGFGMTVPMDIPHLGISGNALVRKTQEPLADASGLKLQIGAEQQSFVRQSLEDRAKAADQINSVVSSNAQLNQAVQSVTQTANVAQSAALTAQTSAENAQIAADQAKAAAADAGRNATNYVSNPGAEVNFDGWTRGGDLAVMTIATDRVHAGAKAWRVVTGSSTPEIQQGDIAVQPGQTWRLSLWFWAQTTTTSSSPTAVGGGVRLQGRDSNGANPNSWIQLSSRNAEIPAGALTTGGWVLQTLDYKVPATGVTHIRTRIAFAAPITVTGWFDDISLQNVTDIIALEAAAQAAQTVADQAQASALQATDSCFRSARQGLGGVTFEGSGAGVQAATIVVTESTGFDGSVIRKPALAGSFWIHDTQSRIPLKDGLLYAVSATIRVPAQSPASTGTCFIGIDGLKQLENGTFQFVNASGNDSHSSQHFFALNNSAIPAGEWMTYTGYFVRAPVSKTTGHGGLHQDPANPGTVYPTATHVQPMILMSYSGKADLVEVSHWEIVAVPLGIQGQVSENTTQITQTTAFLTSRIDQTDSQIRADVATTYVTTSAFQVTQEAFNTALSQTADQVQISALRSSEQIQQVNGALVAYQAQQNLWFRVTPDAAIIGREGSAQESRWTDTSLAFSVASVDMITLSSIDQRVHAPRMQVDESMVMGGFIFRSGIGSDGHPHLTLRQGGAN